MEPILTIDNLNSFGGNMLRQGDKSQLKYRLRDIGNKNLAISGKSCEVTMYGRNYTTIVYETTATVSSDNTVSFTIDKVLPKGTFYLEFTVGDYIFPTDHREFFEITPSGKGIEANIIEIVGKDALIQAVKTQVDTELQPLVTSLESAQQAEIQRASTESSRVSAEAQREIDHANRSAELASKADKIVIRNLVPNGDFSDGTDNVATGFNLQTSTTNPRLVDGVQYWTGSTTAYAGSLRAYPVNLNSGDMYYISAVTSNVAIIFANELLIDTSNVDGLHSSTVLLTSDFTSVTFRVRTINQESSVSNVHLINLTETFGAGNEPTRDEMDRLIETTGYIDGEYSLNNKEMLGHLMKGIHEKANKKQEDWITPTLLNGAEYIGDSFQFRKTTYGTLQFKGTLRGLKANTHFMILPIDYRIRPRAIIGVPTNTYKTLPVLIDGSGGSWGTAGGVGVNGTVDLSERLHFDGIEVPLS